MQQNRKCKIYAWLCPHTGNPVYVGKTSCSIADRMRSHRREAIKRCKTKKHEWYRDILISGLDVKVLILEECSVSDSSKREIYWQEKIELSYPLLNQVKAGCGNPGIGRVKWTPEVLELLGKTTDRAIAKLLGCNRATVTYRRNVLGIERYPDPHIVPSEINLPDYIINRLGKEPDYKLAQELGCSKFVIAKHRKLAGIESYAQLTGNDGRIKNGQPIRKKT